MIKSNDPFDYAFRIVDGEIFLSQVPYHWQNEIAHLIQNYNSLESNFCKLMLKKINNILGEQFAKKRDKIRWINGYGYDCMNEDMVIFLAAFISLESDYNNWVANGSPEGLEPYTPYKVYLNPNSNEKGLIIHTYSQLKNVYNEVRNSQLNDYVWLNNEKEKVKNFNTFEEIFNYYKELISEE